MGHVSSPANVASLRYESYRNSPKSANGVDQALSRRTIFFNGFRRCASNICMYKIHSRCVESENLHRGASLVVGRGAHVIVHNYHILIICYPSGEKSHKSSSNIIGGEPLSNTAFLSSCHYKNQKWADCIYRDQRRTDHRAHAHDSISVF